ncbi:glycosyltransferase [Arthrobacter sp. B10-11]|uniref:glycosyltransferase n=1 Tax=Arthrobacter sp. B10-11 TaxID=3081160 RepID=UPI002954D87A|nr:glycosyltransferase [Arthrobacter sp. B10-11]MDV8146985.1 glycosyltransferase [Arthrobacter sp. B10-11]
MTGLIVHEWISQHGGSENVLDVMARALPNDDIYCLWNEATDRFPGRNVRETWMARSPLRRSKAAALALMPSTWRTVDISKYESVLVSSHAFAHHVGSRKLRATIPIHVYVHTPARYIWAADLDKRGNHPLVRAVAPLFQHLDKKIASEGPLFAANSQFVQRRIENTWAQPSQVIYPPVRIEKLRSVEDWTDRLSDSESAILDELPNEFILGASRFVAYKNLDRVIEVGSACQVPVVLAGGGPEESYLRAKASEAAVPVHFVHSPSDELLYALYQKAMLFVFPPIEDFGIMPVEAMALGTPVLVNPIGGAVESVRLLGGGATLPPHNNSNEVQAAVQLALSKNMERASREASSLSEAAFISRILSWRTGRCDEMNSFSYGGNNEQS